MKRLPILLLALLLLTGCQGLYPDEYASVVEHEAPYAYRETTTVPVETTPLSLRLVEVSDKFDLRDGIKRLIDSGEETGQFVLIDYRGSIEEDMKNMFNSMLTDSPKYAYAMDSFDITLSKEEMGDVVHVRMDLRLTKQEVRAIETLRWPNQALTGIKKAMYNFVSTFTVQISGYEDADYAAILDDYVLHNPDIYVEAPLISTHVYPPDEGSVRIVEFRFLYQNDRENLRRQREYVNDSLDVLYEKLTRGADAQDTVQTLYKSLVPVIGYVGSENATVYTLLHDTEGNSRTMASVVEYLCRRIGADCEIVVGTRNGEPWYWNQIRTEDDCLYFDLHAAALTGSAPALLHAGDMTDYSWEGEELPVEPSAPEETGETAEPSGEPTEAAPDTP